MELTQLILPFSAVFIAGLIEGLAGFGFALVAMPLLTMIFPLQQVVPLILLMNMSVSVILVWQTRKAWSRKAVSIILLASLIGLPLGLFTLKFINEAYLKVAAGIFIITVAFLFIKGTQFHFKKENRGYMMAGLLSGFFGASISLSGPPIVMILNNYGFSKDEFRGTLAMLFFACGIIAIIGFWGSGFISLALVTKSVSLVPALIGGVSLGILGSKKINQQLFIRLTHFILIVMGIVTLFNGIAALF